jgi:heat shock protein HslJ
MNSKILLFLAFGLCMVSCEENKQKAADTQSDQPVEITPLEEPSADMLAMQMQKWELTEMTFEKENIDISVEKMPYLIFREGRASGFAGCNSFVGEYIEGKNNGLNLNKLASTKKMCPDVEKTEFKLLQLLEGTQSYELNNDKTKLKILSTKGQINFVLR